MENLTQAIEQPPLAIEKMKKLLRTTSKSESVLLVLVVLEKSTLLHFYQKLLIWMICFFGNTAKGISPLLTIKNEIDYNCGVWTQRS